MILGHDPKMANFGVKKWLGFRVQNKAFLQVVAYQNRVYILATFVEGGSRP